MPKNVINFSYSLPFNKYNVLCHKTFIMLKQPKIADRQSSLNVQKQLPGIAKYFECPPGTEVGQRLWLGTGVSGWEAVGASASSGTETPSPAANTL